eukprot:GHVU01051651.1.p1 GENE.GHVU01051651.1~~GHVU01051651.1.p1  ORF type:complete len:584 (-),score=65.06 GHVU01051651.1:124-1875(-)
MPEIMSETRGFQKNVYTRKCGHEDTAQNGNNTSKSPVPAVLGGRTLHSSGGRVQKSMGRNLLYTSVRADYNTYLKMVERADCRMHGYHVGKSLGEGAYAKVRLATIMPEKLKGDPRIADIVKRAGHEQVAIKMIDKRKDPQGYNEYYEKFLPREIIALRSTEGHENVVQIYECFETPSHTYIVIEYCENGDLLEYINRQSDVSKKEEGTPGLPETEARRLFKEICSAIAHCHKNGVVHRDLKCENILLDKENRVRVSDFGFSMVLPNKRSLLETACGSFSYAAPEVVMGRKYDGVQADIWSIGVILFAMVVGRLPWFEKNIYEMDEDFRMQRLSFDKGVSQECVMLIRRILQYDPLKRPKIQDILQDYWVLGKKSKLSHRIYQSETSGKRVGNQSRARTSLPTISMTPAVPRGKNLCATVTINYDAGETITLKSRIPDKCTMWAVRGVSQLLEENSDGDLAPPASPELKLRNFFRKSDPRASARASDSQVATTEKEKDQQQYRRHRKPISAHGKTCMERLAIIAKKIQVQQMQHIEKPRYCLAGTCSPIQHRLPRNLLPKFCPHIRIRKITDNKTTPKAIQVT